MKFYSYCWWSIIALRVPERRTKYKLRMSRLKFCWTAGEPVTSWRESRESVIFMRRVIVLLLPLRWKFSSSWPLGVSGSSLPLLRSIVLKKRVLCFFPTDDSRDFDLGAEVGSRWERSWLKRVDGVGSVLDQYFRARLFNQGFYNGESWCPSFDFSSRHPR